MKKILLALSIALASSAFATLPPDPSGNTKKVCETTKDSKGKEKEVCKVVKIHKKLEGTPLPEKK